MAASGGAITAESGRLRGSHGRTIVWRGWSRSRAWGTAADAGDATDVRATRAVVTIAHGYGEHGGRYQHVAERLCAAGFRVYAGDHNGHGRSEGRRGRVDLAAAIADLDQLILNVSRGRHPELPQFLLGHSMGGLIALRYAALRQERLAGLVVSAPLAMVEGGARLHALARLLGIAVPWLPVSRINPRILSRDPDAVSAGRADPLNHHGWVPAATAREFVLATESLTRDVTKITLPTLLMWGTDDRLCPPEGAQRVADAMTRAQLSIERYPGLFHEIFNEPERERVLADVVDWLDAQVEARASRSARTASRSARTA